MANHSPYAGSDEEDNDEFIFDPIALKHVFEIVNRLQRGKCFVGPEYGAVRRQTGASPAIVIRNISKSETYTAFGLSTIRHK